jgi:repressor LexA
MQLKPLTPRQAEILKFIAGFIRRFGVSPSVRDICQGCGIKHPNGVVGHLKLIRAKGYLGWTSHRARTLQLLNEPILPRLDSQEPESFSDLFRSGNTATRDGQIFNSAGKQIAEVRRV